MSGTMHYIDLNGVKRVRDINYLSKNVQGVPKLRARSDLELAQFTEADAGAMFNADESLELGGGAGMYFFDGANFIKLVGGELDLVTAVGGAALVTQANRALLLAGSLMPLTSAGAVSVGTASSTPILPNGYPGQELTLLNTGASNITFTDQSIMANSNLRLLANTIALTPFASLKLVFSGYVGDWIQVGPLS
jgi:hypothetical protein